MKIMLLNKTYDCHMNPSNPCRMCIMKCKHSNWRKIPTSLCITVGGFQSSDTKIFTL